MRNNKLYKYNLNVKNKALKFYTILFISNVICPAIAQAQYVFYQWANVFKNVGSPNAFGQVASVTSDDNGNIYTLGTYHDTVDFDPGPSKYLLKSEGGTSIFLQKCDANGNFIYAKQITSIKDNYASKILYKDGFLYVIGEYSSTAQFFNSIPKTGVGKRNGFLLKMDVAANILWIKTFEGNINEYVNIEDVYIDKNDYIYLCGDFSGSLDLDPGTSISTVNSNGDNDAFVLKLTSVGDFLWGKSYGGAGTDYADRLIIDAIGNIYIGGSFEGTVDFNPGAAINNFLSNGVYDIYILKLSTNGNYNWCKTFGGSAYENFKQLGIDKNNNLIISGSFQSSNIDFDPGAGVVIKNCNGGTDAFLMQLNSAGNFQWLKTIGGIGYDAITDFTLDSLGKFYITGYFSDIVDMDPGNGVKKITSNGNSDIMFIKLDENVDFVAVQSIGGTDFDQANCIMLLNDGILTGGFFKGNIDLDPNTGIKTETGNSIGIFTLKLNFNVATSAVEFDNIKSLNFKLYPNPCYEKIVMKLNVEIKQDVAIVIYDYTGKEYNRKNIALYNGENDISIDCSKLAAGSYIISVQSKDGNRIKNCFTKL